MEKLRIGIVGAGNIAQSAHLPAYKALADRAEVVSITDMNAERAKQVAETFGIKHVYSSAKELISAGGIDCLDVCVWNGAHEAVVVEGAAAGLAMLCEKPMADSLESAQRMAEAVKRAGKPFMMAMCARYNAEPQLLHRMVENGDLGDIYYAKTGLIRRRGTPLGWFTDLRKAGGGPVIDIGVHCIDMTWFLMGRPKPVRISASIARHIGNYQTKGVDRWVALDSDVTAFDTEDSAAAIIHFEGGASMLVETSWAINAPETNYWQICGTKAGATLEPLTIYGENGSGYLTDNKPHVLPVNRFEKEIEHFLDCVRTGKTPDASIDDGLCVQRMLQGMYGSARLGREINLN